MNKRWDYQVPFTAGLHHCVISYENNEFTIPGLIGFLNKVPPRVWDELFQADENAKKQERIIELRHQMLKISKELKELEK
jgi:hypothetical protein